MSEKAINDRIAAILGAVEGIGVVHQYQRLAATWDKFIDLFRYTDKNGQNRIVNMTLIQLRRRRCPVSNLFM